MLNTRVGVWRLDECCILTLSRFDQLLGHVTFLSWKKGVFGGKKCMEPFPGKFLNVVFPHAAIRGQYGTGIVATSLVAVSSQAPIPSFSV